MKSLLIALFATLTLSAGVAFADESYDNQQSDDNFVMSEAEGLYVQNYCGWAPRDPSVCAGRETCKKNVRAATCARYCNVNPHDVVCGDTYRSTPDRRKTPPYGQSPYPWAPPQYGFCDQNPGHISCQQDNWWGGRY